ncbi:MAG: hypothetical protein LC802_05820 [Acidobacteria bacterium]|nr:hypothetical protein [Acidobacteriota bacterium]
MSEDLSTRPTIEIVLERVNALGEVVNSIRDDIKSFGEEIRGDFKDFREEIRGEVTGFREENKLFRAGVELSIDRIESMTNMTRSEMLAMRMDFREIRAHIKQTA